MLLPIGQTNPIVSRSAGSRPKSVYVVAVPWTVTVSARAIDAPKNELMTRIPACVRFIVLPPWRRRGASGLPAPSRRICVTATLRAARHVAHEATLGERTHDSSDLPGATKTQRTRRIHKERMGSGVSEPSRPL